MTLFPYTTLFRSNNTFWVIKQGDIFFWKDHWVESGILDPFVSSPYSGLEKVHEWWNEVFWDWNKLRSALPMNKALDISKMLCSVTEKDYPMWKLTADGKFSSKSARLSFRVIRPQSQMFNLCWHLHISPSISIFCWKLLQGWIPVDAIMQRKGMISVSRCQCCYEIETLEHVFLYNVEIEKVWNFFGSLFQDRKSVV